MLTDTKLKKLKTAVKNKTGTTLRIILEMLNGNDLPRELLLTTRQKTKLRNAFNNNMSTDLKISKAHISNNFNISSNSFSKKCFSSIRNKSRCFSNWCRNSKIQIRYSGTTTLIIPNEEMNYIIKIVQALEDSNMYYKESLKQLKMKQKNKKEDFYLFCWVL